MTDHLTLLVRIRAMAANGRAREIREAARLSYTELADEIGVDASTLLRWESGETKPRGDRALRWLALLESLEAVAA